MKIYQISDIHISPDSDMHKISKNMEKMIDIINDASTQGGVNVLCICGDIVDRGNKAGYNLLSSVFENINSKLAGKIAIEFIPGNHDIVENEFVEFDDFISKFNDKAYSFNSNPVNARDYNDTSIVLVNTSHHKNCMFGKAPFDLLKQTIRSGSNKKIVVMHHSIHSRDESDESVLRNSYDFIKLISEENVSGLLHGHTHGYCNMKLGEQCIVVGVGPFASGIPNVNTQFNEIDVHNGIIYAVKNYMYRDDLENYIGTILYNRRSEDCLYYGCSAKEVYEEVLSDVKTFGQILNLNITVRGLYSDLEAEINNYFSNDLETAREWLSETVPETLWYNHGSHIYRDDAINKIINGLGSKATTSRAILPVICLSDVLESGDDFLPSLDIIQFGFKDDTKQELYITFYLRALEVKHFLRINLCEAFIIASIIKSKIRTITRLSIRLHAFRSQYKEKFGCFKKAEIDRIDPLDLYDLFNDHNTLELIRLLENKLSLPETVVKKEGLDNLFHSYEKYTNKQGDYFGKSLGTHLKRVLSEMDALKSEATETSVYSDIRRIEERLEASMKEAINSLMKIHKENTK